MSESCGFSCFWRKRVIFCRHCGVIASAFTYSNRIEVEIPAETLSLETRLPIVQIVGLNRRVHSRSKC